MKKLIFLAAILATSSASAQNAEEMRKSSLEACDIQAQAMPEAQRDMVLNVCKCTVENTDYDMMMKAQSDQAAMEEVQAAAMKVAQECASSAAG